MRQQIAGLAESLTNCVHLSVSFSGHHTTVSGQCGHSPTPEHHNMRNNLTLKSSKPHLHLSSLKGRSSSVTSATG